MKPRVIACAGLAVAVAALALAPPARPAADPKPGPATVPYGRNLPDPPSTGVLPDSFVLCRVADRVVRAAEFVDTYFNSYAEFRPPQDSLGRVAFLESLIQKDLLGVQARRLNYALSFADRATLREYSNQIYSNVLYQRVVVDPVAISDADVRRAYDYYKHEVHLRHIVFPNREIGERVRRDLLSGRIGWSTAVRRHSTAPDRARDGDLGWQDAGRLGLDFASVAYPLRPGQTSELVRTREGWDLIQCLERRTVDPPAFDGIAGMIRRQLADIRSGRLADALQDSLAAELGLVVDSTNVRWAAARFGAASQIGRDGEVSTLNIDASVPAFSPDDTARVLARHRDGRLTLGEFVHEYSHYNPLMRPNVNEFWMMYNQVVAVALAPYMSELAIHRGIAEDPVAVRLVERRLEEMLVERLYRDSVDSRVQIRPEERRDYYERNKHLYVTYPQITHAAIVRGSRAGIDSVAARIRAGESPRAILHADSASGVISGSIQERSARDQGTPYYRILFEELRPGQFSVVGPDKQGDYLLLAVLTRDDGRQLSFEESEGYVSESLHNLRAEDLLNQFLDRLARRLGVDWRPDLVMRLHFMPAGY